MNRLPVIFASIVFGSALGLAQGIVPRDLTQASLEDLMNIQVTSVSKKEQKLLRTSAAIYVVSQDDIRRSGATNIPDLLRTVPGVNVAWIDANTWAISIRGFNSRYSDKVLVLIDGRSVYMPSFSGVYWDQQNLPLEDIERIEVIRGPGGTVWGANAMNGVINIITKSARATQGGLITAGTGSEDVAQGLVRYGGKIGSKAAYRVFGSYADTAGSLTPSDSEAADGWHRSHGGFRADWDPSPRDAITAEGDIYRTREGQTITAVLSDHLPTVGTFDDRVAVNNADLLGRWTHTLQNGSGMSLQFFYDHVNRLDQNTIEVSNTIDFDFQHHLPAGKRQDIVWGLGYRRTNDSLTPGYDITFDPPKRSDSLYSTFFQDEITIANSLSLTVGSKFEHNAYSGFEYEPSAQLSWAPSSRQALWLSASQAIRQPSRQDAAINLDAAVLPLDGGGFGILKIIGNPDTKAEQLRDYEAGYRAQVNKRFSVDVAAFRSYYQRLVTAEPHDPFLTENPGPPHLVFPLVLANKARARTFGGEVFATWNVNSRWRLSPGFSLLNIRVIRDPSSQDSTPEMEASDTPRHQFQLRSFVNLSRTLDWDTSLSYVGRLRDDNISSYNRLDTRLGWRISESIEISVVGQNLLRPRHFEFGDAFEVHHTQVERSVFGKFTWRF